jgi:acetyl-CoA C-acetyltransferase
MAAEAIASALLDATAGQDDVGALFVGNMTAGMLGQQQQLGGLIADYAGISGIEAISIEAACASGAAAARMGYLTVAAGVHDVALICGVERMTHADRATVTAALATAADWELEGQYGESFLSLNAALMREYIDRYGVPHDAFANFSIVAHANANRNPNAVFHKPIDFDAYASSRVVVEPLRLYDVSPICNGAAAIVLAAGDAARRLRGDRPAIRIEGSTAATAPVALSRRSDSLVLDAVASATDAALATAGVSRAEIDLLELHDAYTIMTVLCLESGGFAAPGTATSLAVENRITLAGDLPIGTFGGLKARGHPVGATGVYQLAEASLQLAGRAGRNQVEGAEIALTQNIGGTGSTVVNHILRRTD